MVLLQLGKEIQSETISELTSSSPESGESSLSNGHSLSDVISDWKRELEEKNCMLRDKIALIHSLEDQLRHKDSEICDVHERCQSVELDRDKNCQMVSSWTCFQSKLETLSGVNLVASFSCFLFLKFSCYAATSRTLHILQHIKVSFLKASLMSLFFLWRRLINWKMPFRFTTSRYSS